MERQKTKWRFQNIAVLCTLLTFGGGWPQVVRAELSDRTVEPSAGDVALSARAPVAPGSSAPIPGIKGSFTDFKMPDESRFWELHGLKVTPELKRGVQRLSEHLIGTSREKTAAFKYCQARKDTAAKQNHLILTPDGIGCLYYRWQTLMKERRLQDSQLAAKTPRSGKKSSRKNKTVATIGLNSPRDFSNLADVPYDTILKKVEFKTEAAALKGAQIAQQSPKDCKLTSARAAVIRDLENFLPSEAIWTAMNQLYAVTAPCLNPTHEAFEVVNGRLALLHLDRNFFDRAASLLEVTLQGKELKDENSFLFWRGYIDSLQAPVVSATSGPSGGGVKPRNTYWERLVEKYPLTLHALVADQLIGVDSYERYAQRPEPTVSVYEGSEWNLENVSHLMASIFYMKSKTVELDRISHLLEDGVRFLSFETAMFRLKMFELAGQSRSAIKTISQSIKIFGSKNLCADLLTRLYPVKFRNEIAQQAAYIDPALVFSLIRQESSFNPKATSPVGARGLMQVMPNTARRIERKRNINLYDPSTNIRIGSKYLHILRKQHNGDYSRLIASYNAGPNSTKKWETRYRGRLPLLFADLIPFPETRHYVSGLMRHMYWYRALVSHVKDTNGTVKINWSWSLTDVVPRPEQFGLAQNQIVQIKLETLPWMPEQAPKSSANSGP